MNKLIKSICVLSAIVLAVFIQSCKKPKKQPEDPCRNAIVVTAMENEMYTTKDLPPPVQGHFTYTDKDFGIVWLFANNWNDYSSQVIPGRKYKLAYTEVPCKNEECGTNGIAEGGCFVTRKCIIINCLKEIECSGCFASVVNPPSYNDEYTSAISASGISGNSLNAKIGFSGCSPDDAKSFQLYLNRLPNRCGTPPVGNDVFEAKAVNTYKGYTCMAYFEKDMCFNLSAIKDYYTINNMQAPAEVTIRLKTNDDQYKDFKYNP